MSAILTIRSSLQLFFHKQANISAYCKEGRMFYHRRSLVFHLLSVFLSITLVTPPANARVLAYQRLETQCGEWNIEELTQERDTRIKTTAITASSGGDCHGAIRLSNDTDVLGFGGYTLELTSYSNNAEKTWVPVEDKNGKVYLLPTLDIEIHVSPLSPEKGATISIQGDMTLGAFTIDLSLFVLRTGLALIPGGGCVIPEEQLLFAALRSSDILSTTAKLSIQKDFIGARDELLQVTDEFYMRAGEAFKEAGVDCAVDLAQSIIKKPLTIVKIGIAYLTWVPVVVFDYLKFGGRTANVSLVYTPLSITSTVNVNSNADLTDPILVVAAINRGLQDRDISVFQSLITTNTKIAAYGGQGIDPNGRWQCPAEGIEPFCYLSPADFLSELTMHLSGTLACQYWYSTTNGLLELEISGWNPVWKWPNGESDTLQLSLQRHDDSNPQSPFEMNFINVQPRVGPGFYDTTCPSPEVTASGLIAYVGVDSFRNEVDVRLVSPDGSNIRMLPLDNSSPEKYKATCWPAPKFSPNGKYLAFAHSTLDFSSEELVIINVETGELVNNFNNFGRSFDWSPDSSQIVHGRDITWNNDGRPAKPEGLLTTDILSGQDQLLIPPNSGLPLTYPKWSPDGSHIAFHEVVYGEGFGPFAVAAIDGTNYDTWDRQVGYFDWSPDGQKIVFDNLLYGYDTDIRLYIAGADGSNERILITDDNFITTDPHWSPDGQYIAFINMKNEGGSLWVIKPDGSELRQLSDANLGRVSWISWSPDGKKIVTSSDKGIHIVSLDGNPPIYIGEGTCPHWQAALEPSESGFSTPQSCEPDDLHPYQWDMRAIDLTGALNQFPGCFPFPVRIAIIDTGVDADHPDLQGHINRTATLIGNDVEDISGHGTHIAGIIGAVQNNGTGIAGIHPHARLGIYKYASAASLFVRIQNWETSFQNAVNTAQLIRAAVNNGEQVVNVSSGWTFDVVPTGDGRIAIPCEPAKSNCNGVLRSAVQYASDNGVIIVAASGNSGRDEAFYPAAFASTFPNVIAVAASTPDGKLALYSSTGSHITIAAPGGTDVACTGDGKDCVLSLWPKGSYKEMSGTSMAAAHVTGVVALMLSANPNLSPQEVKDIILHSYTDWAVDTTNAGPGIINASRAVLASFQRSNSTSVSVGGVPSPILPLDRMSVESVMEWISDGLASGDMSVFEELLTGDSISYGTGFAGGRDQIPRDEFLRMLTERILSRPACEGYVDNETSLGVWTSGWEPDWLSKGISNDTLTFTLWNNGEGFSLTTAYFTPAPAILDSPSINSKPCPRVP